MESSKNKKIWESKQIVAHYSKLNSLSFVENKIFESFSSKIKDMRVLDIGVGSGRTTSTFGFSAKEYLGIDYSSKMIESCKIKFKNKRNIKFLVQNAVEMTDIPDNYFDFVLFSFNGIDYASDSDRNKIFLEVKRVTKSDGFFCFSSHNLKYNFEKYYNFKIIKHPINFIKYNFRSLLFKIKNRNVDFKKLDSFDYIIDDAFNFSLQTYYIDPFHQISILERFDFHNIELFSTNGEKISVDDSNLDDQSWIYYLCQITN